MEPRWHRAGVRKPPINEPSARVLPKLFAHSQSLFDLLCAARTMPAEEEAMTTVIASSTRSTRQINAGLADATIKARLGDLGGVPMPMSAAEFGKFIADETEKWAKVVKFLGANAN
jgi:hypothetical protein